MPLPHALVCALLPVRNVAVIIEGREVLAPHLESWFHSIQERSILRWDFT